MVVVPLKRKPGTIKNLINPDEMDMEEVRYVERKKACKTCSRYGEGHSRWFRIGIFVEKRTRQLC